jgi:hypothetical protein
LACFFKISDLAAVTFNQCPQTVTVGHGNVGDALAAFSPITAIGSYSY